MNSVESNASEVRGLRGRVALITGAASGIGETVARRLVALGATTIFSDINDDAVKRVVATQVAAHAEAASFDVADPDAWSSAVDRIAQTHGRLDILVNCAGVYHIAAATETAFRDWNRVITTNLSSVFYSLKFAAPLMSKSADAVIVNIASSLGLRPRAFVSAYAASKAGVISFTRSAALEFAQHGWGIRVNALCPGPTDTPILETLDTMRLATLGGLEAVRRQVMQTIPLGRLGSPDEIADAVVFLVSDRAKFMTGSCLVVDGGQSA